MARYINLDDVVLKGIGVFDENLDLLIPLSDVRKALQMTPTADVVPKSEEGAECPTCHGTGRIGTTDWLTKNISKKKLAEEKARAIAEHEQHIKAEVAREIFGEIEKCMAHDYIPTIGVYKGALELRIAKLKKKYTEGSKNDIQG